MEWRLFVKCHFDHIGQAKSGQVYRTKDWPPGLRLKSMMFEGPIVSSKKHTYLRIPMFVRQLILMGVKLLEQTFGVAHLPSPPVSVSH